MVVADPLMQVAQTVGADPVGLVHHVVIAFLAAVGSPDGNVIGRHAEVLKALLHGDADGTATAPQADQEVRTKTRAMNGFGQLEGVEQQVVCADVVLVHDREPGSRCRLARDFREWRYAVIIGRHYNDNESRRWTRPFFPPVIC